MKIIRPQSNQPLPRKAKKVFQGRLFSVYQWEQKLFDGTFGIFEKITRRDTVGIIAVTQEGKILLTHQEQPGVKPFMGTPGGIIDRGEEPFHAAQRELVEETGYVSTKWSLYQAIQPTTKIDWAIFTFLAKDCKKIQEPTLDAGEKVKVQELSLEDFIDSVRSPLFRDKELALKILRELTNQNGLASIRHSIFD